MHFTSYSTKTHIVLLDTFISLPKSLKNPLKSVTEATSDFFASPERFWLPFWEPKFQKICWKSFPDLPAHPKSRKDCRKWCQDASKGLHEAPKQLPKCSKGLSKGSNLANHFRPQSKTHNSPFAACSSHAPQLSPWNFQDNCSDPNAKFTSHDAQFAVHRTQVPFRLDLIVATYLVSKLVVHIQLLIVHRSQVAACCSYVQ